LRWKTSLILSDNMFTNPSEVNSKHIALKVKREQSISKNTNKKKTLKRFQTCLQDRENNSVSPVVR